MKENTKYNLFLDDDRDPEDVFQYMKHPIYLINDDWEIVRNYDDFVKIIQEKGIPDKISFDHDLGIIKSIEKTGYDCAKWLIYYCLDNNKKIPAEIFIHSMNPVGSANIKSLFDTYEWYM